MLTSAAHRAGASCLLGPADRPHNAAAPSSRLCPSTAARSWIHSGPSRLVRRKRHAPSLASRHAARSPLRSSFWGERECPLTFSSLLLMVICAACQISAVRGASAEWCAPSLYASTKQHLNASITNPAWMCPLEWKQTTRQRLSGAAAPMCATKGDGASTVLDRNEPGDAFGIGNIILGIDIGGTSVKGAPVDTRTGQLIRERHRICTPQPATPEAVAAVVKEMTEHFNWTGPVGIGFPAAIRDGQALTAANLDKRWIGVDATSLFTNVTGSSSLVVVNDADAAGYAEMGFGTGQGERGAVLMITFGTGVGTALFIEEVLVPNLELGHIEIDGEDAEPSTAGVVVERLGLTWDQWAQRVTRYLTVMERLLWPNLIIVGGGVSEAADQWLPLVKLPGKTEIKVATMRNDAGIVGAALACLAKAALDYRVCVTVDELTEA